MYTKLGNESLWQYTFIFAIVNMTLNDMGSSEYGEVRCTEMVTHIKFIHHSFLKKKKHSCLFLVNVNQ